MATSEPDTEADGAATDAVTEPAGAGSKRVAGAAAKAVMELLQEPLSDP